MRHILHRAVLLLFVMALVVSDHDAAAQPTAVPRGQKWVATWAAAAHGPYPSGNASAQPVLDFAFESPERGAIDQTFRLIAKPDLWGGRIRLRFSNAFGTQPVTFDEVFVGLQSSGGNVVAGTNVRVAFERGRRTLTLPPGASAFSDPVTLAVGTRGERRLLAGRKLAVSFHINGASGPMTWHAKALTTSYLTAPRAGSHGADESDDAFPYTTTSWYFLDAIDVEAPARTAVVVCFGDSITDGTASTLNGDDRWPDVLSRRLHAAHGDRVSVVNAGIGGNQVVGPPVSSTASPFAGGPSALARLDRDVLSLSGLTSVIWLEGINDLSAGASAEAVIAGFKEGVRRLRAHGPVRVIGATITSSVGATTASGTPENDAKRKIINEFIRTGGLFDAVADFDAATRDPQTGGLKAAYQPNSTTGGAGDRLHPNRAGYHAMGSAIDLSMLVPGR
ncbi:MAG: GDSL-type esterase/lipase family protein [Vicinamibacterales bacterium]